MIVEPIERRKAKGLATRIKAEDGNGRERGEEFVDSRSTFETFFFFFPPTYLPTYLGGHGP